MIGAGAGNPPCIVDETADLVKAAEDIISGAAFDYNLPCIAEKSLIVVASVADRLIQQMQDFDALLLSRQEADTLRAVCLPDGAANKKLVGKSPAALLAAAGLAVPPRPSPADSRGGGERPGDLRAADAGAADRQGRRL